MTQQDESTAPVGPECLVLGQKCCTEAELKGHGLHPDDSIPNESAHSSVQNPTLRVENFNMGGRDESFPRSLECRSMHQSSGDSGSLASGQFDSHYRNEQMILTSYHREQSLHNHQSFSIQNNDDQFVHGPIPQPPVKIGLANSQGTTRPPAMYQNYDSSSQAQPMSSEAGQGRVVTPNYSGVQKQMAPETGGSLMSLRNKQLNEQDEVNHNYAPQSINNEEGQAYVVMQNYSGQLNRIVPETENPLSLRNKQLSDQNTVNYSIKSQPSSLDQTVGQSSAHSNERMVMPNHSGEVMPPNKERLWSMENRRLNEQNVSLNRSVGAPHSSQMPFDVRNDPANQNTAPNQHNNRNTTHFSPPPADQIVGSAHRNPVGPHGFVRDTNQHQGSVHPGINQQKGLVYQSANQYQYSEHKSEDMLTVRQGNAFSLQTRDNRGDPNHPPRQSNQIIGPPHQQQPGQYNNPPEQYRGNLPGQYGNPPVQSYAAGGQGNQLMDVNYNQSQMSDGGQQRHRKKVFILHYDDVPPNPDGTSSVLQLAVTLLNLEVDVTVDLFTRDNPPNSWPLWYEQEITKSNVVLCMITENFYNQLTTGSTVTGYSLYNLMNLSTIAVRAVFLNVEKKMDYVPPSMRGATCYCLKSGQLGVEHEEFVSLYAFLTGQNRIQKPTLGKMVMLTPRKSRFGANQGGQRTVAPAGGFSRGPAPGGMGPGNYNMRHPNPGGYGMGQPPHGGYNMGHPPHMAANRGQYPPAGFNQGPPPQQQVQPGSYGAPSGPAASQPDVDQANLLYSLLAGDMTEVSKIRTHNRMLQTLATKMAADWEPLARTLGLRDAEVYAIRRDNQHSVVEQAVQMFRTWLEKNGSKATLSVLTTAVYDTGMQYWNLLETINKHSLK